MSADDPVVRGKEIADKLTHTATNGTAVNAGPRPPAKRTPRRTTATHNGNGHTPAPDPEPIPDEPPDYYGYGPPDDSGHHNGETVYGGGQFDVEHQGDSEREATTWESVDLGPWLTGNVEKPQPSIGAPRSDGQRLIYPGREHTIYGETEAGKSWLALACVAVELINGNPVVYIHYEEGDPGSTIERLRLLGVPPAAIAANLRFVAPARAAHADWLTPLLDPAPVLVIHDGVNEAMSLHSADIMAADGAATFRRRLIKPFLAAGAATISCDHVTKSTEGRGRYAYGAGHKLNAIDGAAFMVENSKPFGRGLRGASWVFITKDRPGQLRAHGQPTKIPGKTFYATLVVDDTPTAGADFLGLYAPHDGDDDTTQATADPNVEIAENITAVIAAQTDGKVGTLRLLYAHLRKAGYKYRDTDVRDALDDLVLAGKLTEILGQRNSRGFQTPTPVDKPA